MGILGVLIVIAVIACVVWAQIGGLFGRKYPRDKDDESR
jgi:hypothetical protein